MNTHFQLQASRARWLKMQEECHLARRVGVPKSSIIELTCVKARLEQRSSHLRGHLRTINITQYHPQKVQKPGDIGRTYFLSTRGETVPGPKAVDVSFRGRGASSRGIEPLTGYRARRVRVWASPPLSHLCNGHSQRVTGRSLCALSTLPPG